MRTVVNFATDVDRAAHGEDRLSDDVESVRVPIDSETATRLTHEATEALRSGDFAALPPQLNPEIHRLLVHEGAASYRRLVEIAADPHRRALVFHCSHGVHRTGTGAAILLTLLGVPWETVRADFLSNTYRKAEVDHRLHQLRALAARSQGILPEDVDMTNVEAFMIQDGSYIDATRDEITTKFGSFDRYADEALSLDASVLSELRATLLE